MSDSKLVARLLAQAHDLDVLAEALENLAADLLTSSSLAAKAEAAGSSTVAVASEHLLIAARFRESAGSLRQLARASFRDAVRHRRKVERS